MATTDPWYCYIPGVPADTPGCTQVSHPGGPGFSWADAGIRGGLILLGSLLLLIVLAKSLSKPSVIVEK